MGTFYTKNGYDIEITVGSILLDTSYTAGSNGLCNSLDISGEENSSRVAIFSFRPARGTAITPEAWVGKDVTIQIKTENQWYTVFTGKVDSPRFSIIDGTITLSCSDQRQNKIIQLENGIVEEIGQYHTAVFGVTTDKAEELEKRLQTVTASFDFDAYGNWKLTSWTPKITADYTITSSSVKQLEEPEITYINRSKAINTINITLNYSYQRLHQQCASFNWAGYTDFMADWWNMGKPSFPARATIESAALGTDWKIVSNGITYVPLWEAQVFGTGSGAIIWQPNHVQEEFEPRQKFVDYLKDSSGNFVTVGSPAKLVAQYEPVYDGKPVAGYPNGKPVMDVVRRTITDTSSHLCKSASWSAALRFTQNIVEQFTITLQCPQAVALYGVIDSYNTISYTDSYDASVWENSDTISFTTQNFYIEKKDSYADFTKAMYVALLKAKHDLLQTFRDFRVSVVTRNDKIKPYIDLHHTISIDIDRSAMGETAYLTTKGKCSSIVHRVNFETEEAYSVIELRLSRSTGSATNSPWIISGVNDSSAYIGGTNTIQLKTYIGRDPNPDHTPGADKWTGWICNNESDSYNFPGRRTTYQESFIVDYPKIPDIIRNKWTNYSSTVLDLEIPNDDFEGEF